jgi:hypothetical protein
LVESVAASLDFWCRLCRFEVLYDRPEEGFAYIAQGSAHLMLEQIGVGRNWLTGPLDRPLGRGINFQIRVPAVGPVCSSLREAGWPLFMELETKWYRTGNGEAGGDFARGRVQLGELGIGFGDLVGATARATSPLRKATMLS